MSPLPVRRTVVATLGIATAIAGCRPAAPTPTPPAPAPTPAQPAVAPAAPGAAAPSAVVFADGWSTRRPARATTSAGGMVVTNSPAASEAGAEILRAGGNAVDAAVATGFALAVSWPTAGNLGGGGFAVIQLADGRRAAIDYREQAPQSATRDMYVRPDGTTGTESIVGWRASGVPGSVAGLLATHARFGKLPRAAVMAPAIRLAREGVVVDSGLYESIAFSRELIAKFAGREVFLRDGAPPPIGSRLVQPALARTLEAIAAQGETAFYRGWIADSIDAEMARNGGTITKGDLARYTAAWRDPLVWRYRDWTVVGMPPSSSGGVTMAETMNILENERALPPFGSTMHAHLLASALQRSFIDRNTKLGDPDFVRVPLAELASKPYARRLWETIDRTRATPTPAFDGTVRAERPNTTHYSVVDGEGNAVATTTTLNNSWGSGVYLASVGVLMNDEMDDFAIQPGKPNMFGLVQGEANAIAPGKRMLSAMSPTVVLDRAGSVRMVAGAAGGPRIISATMQVILNVIEHGMSLPDAMAAPRLHHQSLPDSIRWERGGIAPAVRDSLAAMGHRFFAEPSGIGNVNAILRVPGGWQGVHEPRSWGAAVGPR